jgi:tetratricopeptide (TPR) repeat protein
MHDAYTAITLNDLGVLLYQSGRYDEAMSMYQQALPIEREVFGPEHPEVATVINNIGRAALMSGHIDDAEPLLRQALLMTEKFEGDTHDDLVSPLNSLAMIDAYRGHLDAASREIQRADSIARLPNQGELLDQVLLNEADIALANGDPKKAAALLAESKVLLIKAHPDGPANAWRYAVWNAVNAQLLAANGDSIAALTALTVAQSIIIQRFGPSGFHSVIAKQRIASVSKARRS